MQDAFGGIVNIFLLVILLIIIEGIFAFTVSYTKAFKMKNYVISSIEQYEGSPTCFEGNNSACINRVKEYAKNIAYKPANIQCHDLTEVQGLFCYGESTEKTVYENSAQNKIYRVTTQVDISFPLIGRIMGLKFFQVSGDTRVIKLNN